MKNRVLLIVVTAMLAVGAASMAAGTPVGDWETIDDKTGQPQSIIHIAQVDGELQGTVTKFLRADAVSNATCTRCDGARKDQPILGMAILWGMKPDGDAFSGGTILDTRSGKTYRCRLTLSRDGSKLEVRGYIGLPALGGSQTWLRQ
ncbi:MAG: hypothetical protein JWQ90_939 [Hydrocarboniphaga sp.]|uniref:DUF2147 domain-containing protein n=1 Tax=Hydrocarboniphaga sp. TaxID=2033016 RepID=UPI0026097791|nr:DUF2147 domain-containing protein [Hydrocarboniphaga sp.]MDB5968489.1 hypothetical protein [Hydrocarboniphaga sp.]